MAKKKIVGKRVKRKASTTGGHPRKKAKAASTPTKKARKGAKKTKGSCFVLMPFKEPFDLYYGTIICPAILAANLKPDRADSLFTSTPIMGHIWRQIQDTKVLVGVLTERNPNVFYELGLAHAIGKPVVLVSETMDDVPFDLTRLRVITYDKDVPSWGSELKTSLTKALEASLSDPAEAVPPMFRKKVKSQAPAESDVQVRLAMLERQVEGLSRTGARRSFRGVARDPAHAVSLMHRAMISEREGIMVLAEFIREGCPPEKIEEELLRRPLTPKRVGVMMERVMNAAEQG